MATLYTLRSGATQHPEAMMGFLASRLVTVAGTFDKDSDHFKCEQQSTPDMTVKVNDGYALIPLSDLSFVHPVELDGGDGSVTIGANSSGNDRIDAIVLYIDRSASANTTATNVATLYVVEGTPAGSPVAPTDNEIQTEIGASNPFLRLADVTVENGTSDITDSDITDQRVDATYSTKVASDWVNEAETWVYATASTFTIAGVDLTSRYTKGTRLRFKQGGSYKYAVVVGSSFSTNTTVTIAVNTDYTIANATITDNFYSYQANPTGYPVTFTVTVTNGLEAKISMIGRELTISGWSYLLQASGGSTTVEKTITHGFTFATVPIVVAQNVGIKYTTAPTTISDLTVSVTSDGLFKNFAISAITTTTFKAHSGQTGSAGADTYRGFSWIVKGNI